MAGQIDTNKYVTAIKEKQAQIDTSAAAGTDKLTDASAKITELKAEMSALIPTLPVIPSLQGELSKLGSLNAADLLAKVSSLTSTFASAVPGLSDLMGTMGLSSFPPTIDTGAITEKIPNVEEVDGEVVTQPSESLVAEEPPAAPVEKVVVEIDYDELSMSFLRRAWGTARRKVLAEPEAKKPNTKADRSAIRRIWTHAHYVKLAAAAGTTIEEVSKYKNTVSTASYDRYIAEYTGAAGYDVNLLHTKMQERYNVIRDNHPESTNILDWTAVLQKYWEMIQRIK